MTVAQPPDQTGQVPPQNLEAETSVLGSILLSEQALDPLLIDCAFQMQVLWARLHWDVTLLPGAVDSVVRVATGAHVADGIRHELRIRPESGSPLCHADHYFYGPDARLLGAMMNAQGVGSNALNRLGTVHR